MTTIWLGSVVFIVVVGLIASWMVSPPAGIGVGFLVSLLIPSWVDISVFDQTLEARLAAMLGLLALYCIDRRSVFPLRLVPLDFLVMGLLVAHALSDTYRDGWHWTLVPRIYCEWCVPYICGRLAFVNEASVRRMAVVGTWIAILFTVLAAVEGLMRIHPWEIVFGERPLDGIGRSATRWGVLRAWGQSKHSIFFGLTQLILSGFLFCYASRKSTELRQSSYWLLCVVPVIGVFFSGSRAAMVGLIIAYLFVASCHSLRFRWLSMAALGALIILTFSDVDRLIHFSEEWSGETRERNLSPQEIVLNDQQVSMSGTRSRLHLLRYYRPAVLEGGLLGFGSTRTEGFPVRVPVGRQDTSATSNLQFVDNAYLLMTLRFGYLGLTFFALSLLGSAYVWWRSGNELRTAFLESGADWLWRIYFSGIVMGVAIGLLTVWLPYDVSFPLLFTIGGASVQSHLGKSLGGYRS
jgi:hypothetical protein